MRRIKPAGMQASEVPGLIQEMNAATVLAGILSRSWRSPNGTTVASLEGGREEHNLYCAGPEG